MNNILTIANSTIREAFSKKIIITFFAISTFTVLGFILFFSFVPIDDLTGIIRFSKGNPLDLTVEITRKIKLLIVAPLFGGGLFLSIFSASGFIPAMLENGSVDLILSKPISRTQIILGKFLGGVTVVFINIAFLIFALWFLMGLKFSVWSPYFLYCILTITFTFASLYSLIILIGIITKSSMFAMMLTYLIFFVLSPLLAAREQILMLVDDKLTKNITEILYHIIPKTTELGSLTTELAIGSGVGDWLPIITTFLFMILVLYISIFIFNKKDF
ncbi:MAG: hypothetical protein CR986_04745 [Ignavibacteriae bacterium]|nr:MAG: hypothetical protein CR986_04745 [Ignavibacteriota bacterium]